MAKGKKKFAVVNEGRVCRDLRCAKSGELQPVDAFEWLDEARGYRWVCKVCFAARVQACRDARPACLERSCGCVQAEVERLRGALTQIGELEGVSSVVREIVADGLAV